MKPIVYGVALGFAVILGLYAASISSLKLEEIKSNITSARQKPAVQWCRDQGHPYNWRINEMVICIDKDGHLIYAKEQ